MNECNGKIHIVHIVEGFIGGVEKYLCNVLGRLVDSRFDISLICSVGRCWSDAEKKLERLRQCGVKVYVIEMERGVGFVKDIKSFLKILNILRKGRFDVVHTHCSKAGALGRITGVLAGVDVRIHSPHCFAYLRTRNRLKAMFYKHIEKCLKFITSYFVLVSMGEKKIAINEIGVSRERCFVVQNGVEIKNEKTLQTGNRQFTVLTACRFVEYKGLDKLIKAAKLLKGRNVKFIIAGKGEIGKILKEKVIENGIGDMVGFAGYIDDMKKLYREADVFVLASEAEGQPYVLLEAMNEGLGFIATDVLGNSELIERSGAGVAVSNCPEELARKIEMFLEKKEELQQLGERGIEYVRRYHSLERQVRELAWIYQNVTTKVVDEDDVYGGYSSV